MEDGGQTTARRSGTTTPTGRTPPPPPNPNAGPSADELDEAYRGKSDEPLKLDGEDWDITAISGLAALRMLMLVLDQLAEATGDVPPTPPVSRPLTPRHSVTAAGDGDGEGDDGDGGVASCGVVSSPGHKEPDVPRVDIGSPEAHPHEPVTIVDGSPVEHHIQHAAIARRFFSRVAPPFTLAEYLTRFHHFCPHSPGVYLAAAVFCHRLCVEDYMVPATKRTIHRLALAAIRVAAKSLEDHKWTQDRVARIGGISKTQLLNLEITMLFLLDFEIGVNAGDMARRMFMLQQSARQRAGALNLNNFRLNLPAKKKRQLSRS